MEKSPSEEIYITLIQTDLYWEDIAANLAMLEEKIWQIGKATDLVVLPEMFNTGFTMNVKQLAEPMNLTTFKWLRQQAKQTNAVITGSFIVKEKEHYYNRLLWMCPDGSFTYYDKRHLFRMAKEHDYYYGGNKLQINELKGWKFCPLICYDLRFPVWSRNTPPLKYDCLMYVANWPQARSLAWNTLLRARAIENLSYCIGVNRVGVDGKGISYAGESAAIDFRGNELYYQKDVPSIETICLKYADLEQFRQNFPAYLDADKFDLKME
ncbi:MAG: amidohydrolase [Thermoflexibacter sp.]|jgi:predicted amidohydrolase|nr:amidohydrolase [Thermoflexibacter sp.]